MIISLSPPPAFVSCPAKTHCPATAFIPTQHDTCSAVIVASKVFMSHALTPMALLSRGNVWTRRRISPSILRPSTGRIGKPTPRGWPINQKTRPLILGRRDRLPGRRVGPVRSASTGRKDGGGQTAQRSAPIHIKASHFPGDEAVESPLKS